jgi:anti-anti-sigma factor
MEISTEYRDDGIERIILIGRMDSAGADQIDMRFTSVVATHPTRIVVDMMQVSFLSSLGVRLLLSNAKALKQRGGRMVIARPQPHVEEVLKIVGMDALIPVHADVESACAALNVPA